MRMLGSLTGGCACGSVRYRALGRPIIVCGCCCTDCAKASGTPYTVWVGFFPSALEFTRGRPHDRQTSSVTQRGHCLDCGTPLTFRRIGLEAKRDPLLYVTAASLDDPDAVRPSEVIYYADRPAWFELPPDLPRHPGPSPDYGSPLRHGKLN